MVDTAKSSEKKFARGCLIGLLVAIGITSLIWCGIQYVNQQSDLALERHRAERRQREFQKIKNGNSHAHIMDARLLTLLAEDRDCLNNIEELHFDMVTITPVDAEYVAKFTNVRSLGFYDSHGADHVLKHSHSLPIEEMYFEMTRLSEESLKSLKDFTRLKEVRFEHVMYPNEVKILKSLPLQITVRIPFPSEDELSR